MSARGSCLGLICSKLTCVVAPLEQRGRFLLRFLSCKYFSTCRAHTLSTDVGFADAERLPVIRDIQPPVTCWIVFEPTRPAILEPSSPKLQHPFGSSEFAGQNIRNMQSKPAGLPGTGRRAGHAFVVLQGRSRVHVWTTAPPVASGRMSLRCCYQ